MNIPESTIVTAAKAMDAYWGGRYAPDEVDELRGEVTAILEAVAPSLRAEGWDVCAGAVGAATRLVAPDDITPVGARVINQAASKNPYRNESTA